ncbi:hypothetical protein GEMRC1_003837 [Eukaryota sp. GEM-RC1]
MIGQPYIGLFAESMERLFFVVYNSCDPATKHELLNLNNTWLHVLPLVHRNISSKLVPPMSFAQTPMHHTPQNAPPSHRPANPNASHRHHHPAAAQRKSQNLAHHPIIEKMYGSPHYCPLCAMRFSSEDIRDKHMDTHVVKSKPTSQQRQLYLNASDWATYGTPQRTAEARDKSIREIEQQDLQEQKPRIAVESVEIDEKKCFVCDEEFNLVYDDDEDEWMFEDCIYDADAAELYHSSCYKQVETQNEESLDAGEKTTSTNRIRS